LIVVVKALGRRPDNEQLRKIRGKADEPQLGPEHHAAAERLLAFAFPKIVRVAAVAVQIKQAPLQ
jgi:hypothetical protein